MTSKRARGDTQHNKNMSNKRRRVDMQTRAEGVGTQRSVVHSTYTDNAGVSDENAILYGFRFLTPDGLASTDVVRTIASCYEFFRLRSAAVDLVPYNGTTLNGVCQWAFIDNPELMKSYVDGTNAMRSAIINNTQNVTSTSLLGQSTKVYNTNRITSRSWYQCNSDFTSDLFDYERSVPVLFVYRIFFPTLVSIDLPVQFVFRMTFELRGLGSAAAGTLSREMALDNRRARAANHAPEGEPPERVETVSFS